MSFGDDNQQQQVTPLALPPPPPAAPQFAAGKLQPKGLPYGGTLLTSPLSPAPRANTARQSLTGMT